MYSYSWELGSNQMATATTTASSEKKSAKREGEMVKKWGGGRKRGSCSTANKKVNVEQDAGNWDSRRLNELMNERKLVIYLNNFLAALGINVARYLMTTGGVLSTH